MSRTLRELGEFGLIDRWTNGPEAAGAAGSGVTLGVGDDCAVLDDGGDGPLLITCDLMAEDVHFLRSIDPERLGDKLMSVNLSDVAAMGGTPRHAVIALALPDDVPLDYLDGVYRGLYRRAARHGVALVGGDTTGSRAGLVLSLTLTGRGDGGAVLLRSGARAGERVLVSGTLGDAGAGLALLLAAREAGGMPSGDDADERWLIDRHELPEPRVELGRRLARAGGVGAAIDLSDGLASDLGHVARRSGVGARIDAARLPLSDALRRCAPRHGWDPVALALTAGEDYELCVTAAPDAVPSLQRIGDELGVPLHDVGEIVEDTAAGVRLSAAGGGELDLAGGGWDHFG